MPLPSFADPDDSNVLTIDEQLELLSSRYRRYTLYRLSRFPAPVSLAQVADYITKVEFEGPADELPDERIDVYTELYHVHVPVSPMRGSSRTTSTTTRWITDRTRPS